MGISDKYRFDYAPDKQVEPHVLRYIWAVVRRQPGLWTLLVITDVLHALRYPLAYLLMGLIIDTLLQQPAGADIPTQVWYYIAGIFGVLLIGELCHLLPHYLTFNWMERIRPKLRSDLLAYTLDHSFTYFQDNFAGGLARKTSEGIEKLLDFSVQLRWEFMLPVVGMLTSATVLLQVSWLYSLAVFVFIALIVFPIALRLNKIRGKSQHFADVRSRVTGQIVDTLTNIAAVKSFAREKQELEEHRKVAEEEIRAWHKMLRVFLLLDNYRRMTLVVFGAGMMLACVLGWQHGIITAGEIATIMGISFNFTALAWNMSFGIIHMSESLGYLNDSLHTLVQRQQVKDAPDAVELEVTRGEIHFQHVGFEYEGQPVFQQLEVMIPPCQRVGLVGPSGAGKSTFVNLIQRFFDVQEGQICIDGQDIATVTQQSLRENVAVIPQDTALFHRSILDNIRYGRLDASDEEVMEAARKAYAHEFIMRLPEQYHTQVGERGVKLSGGQRQRIAIARAILKNAPILLLDEATSALDSESEQLIEKSLSELMKGKTVIAIAHRLSTINHLDRLLVMERGQVIEDGNHELLLQRDGLYARLWKMQSGGFLQD